MNFYYYSFFIYFSPVQKQLFEGFPQDYCYMKIKEKNNKLLICVQRKFALGEEKK